MLPACPPLPSTMDRRSSNCRKARGFPAKGRWLRDRSPAGHTPHPRKPGRSWPAGSETRPGTRGRCLFLDTERQVTHSVASPRRRAGGAPASSGRRWESWASRRGCRLAVGRFALRAPRPISVLGPPLWQGWGAGARAAFPVERGAGGLSGHPFPLLPLLTGPASEVLALVADVSVGLGTSWFLRGASVSLS